MALTTYGPGQTLRLSMTLTSGGALIDPATLTVTVRTPDDADTTASLAAGDVTRDSQGVYHYDLLLSQGGLHEYTWTTTSPRASLQSRFVVRPPMR